MIRKITFLSLVTSMLFLTTNSYAMHINLNLGDDLIANKDTISFVLAEYYKKDGQVIEISNTRMQFDGMPVDRFQQFMSALNQAIASDAPISPTGNYKAFSFGYSKVDETKFLPASCQNLQATMEMNIAFNEAGCVVS